MVSLGATPVAHRRRRNGNKKAWPVEMIPRRLPPVDGIFRCVQSLESTGVIVSSTSLATFIAFPVSLSGLDQNAQLAAVFDHYRIIEIEYQFLPRYQYETSGSFTAYNPGIFHTVVDTTDDTALTTIASALDYPSCKAWSPGRPNSNLVQRFNPQCVVTTTSYQLSGRNDWFSTSYASTAWNGVKTAWTVTSAALTMDAIVRVLIEFRRTR